jgi:hypothetical protein
VIKERIPAPLVRDCQAKRRGPLPTAGAIVDRLTYTEGALDECGTRMKKIRQWNDRQ